MRAFMPIALALSLVLLSQTEGLPPPAGPLTPTSERHVRQSTALVPWLREQAPAPAQRSGSIFWEQVGTGAVLAAVLTLGAAGAWEAAGPRGCAPRDDNCSPVLWYGEADAVGLLAIVGLVPPFAAVVGSWLMGLRDPDFTRPLGPGVFGVIGAHLLSPLLFLPIALFWGSNPGDSGIQAGLVAWIVLASFSDALVATALMHATRERKAETASPLHAALSPIRTMRGTPSVVPALALAF